MIVWNMAKDLDRVVGWIFGLLLCQLWATMALLAQEPAHRVLTRQQGLPSNTIYDLWRSRDGYVWIASDKGLFRYDGLHFRSYHHKDQKMSSVTDIREDEDGRIWCQNFVGQLFYAWQDSLYAFDGWEPSGVFVSMGMLHRRYLAGYGLKGLRVLDTRTDRVRIIPVREMTAGHVATYSDGDQYYVRSDNGQFLIALDSSARVTYIPTDLGDIPNTFFHFTRAGRHYFVGRGQGQTLRSVAAARFAPIVLSTDLFTQNVKWFGDELMVMTTSGLYRVDQHWQKMDHGRIFFREKNISNGILDEESNWWLTTINGGLLFVPNRAVWVDQKHLSLTTVEADPWTGGLLVGTSDGKVYTRTQGQWQLLHESVASHEVVQLFRDPENGHILFTTNGLYRYEGHRLLFSTSLAVKDVARMGAGKYVIAATGSVFLAEFDQKPLDWDGWESYDHLQHNNTVVPGLHRQVLNEKSFRARAIAVDTAQGLVYVATSLGLFCYTRAGSEEIKYKGLSLSASDVVIAGQKLYVSTYTEGILEIAGRKVLRQLPGTLVPGNAIYKIKYNRDRLWWITDQSLCSYDLRTDQLAVYDRSDGLPDADYKDLALAGDSVYMATSQGLISLPVGLKSHNDYPPKLLISALSANGRRISLDSIPDFDYTQNNLRIQFDALAFRANERLQVRYQLNDQPWMPLAAQIREITLPSLSPDHYTLRVQAFNEDGVPSEVVSLQWVIRPPFWSTWWFVLCCLVVLSGGIWKIYDYQISQLRSRNKLESDKMLLEQELQKSVLASIKAQMNPHFIFNALNTIQSYIYLNDKQNASRYLVKFSDLMRLILDMSNTETISLADEVRMLTLYLELEKMRFEDNFACSVQVSEDIDPHQHRLHSMLIQPYVENAIKHGLMHKKGARKLWVKFEKKGEKLVVTIEDNGIGREMSAQINRNRANRHRSFATHANQKRLELLNMGQKDPISVHIADNKDANGQPIGTTVTLHIPCNFVEE